MAAFYGAVMGPGMQAGETDMRFDVDQLTWSGSTVRVLNARPVQNPRALIVIVHGYGEHAGRYENLARTLAGMNVAVTAADLPGHGHSEDAPGELGEFEHLDGLLKQVCDASHRWNGDVPLILLGHSLGGLIVAGFAARNPDVADALIFSSPVLGRWSAIEAFEGLESIPPSMVRAWHLSNLASFADEYEDDQLLYRGPVARGVLASAKDQLAVLCSGGQLSGQRMLWMHGAADRIVPSADALRAFADLGVTDMTARIFEGARHEVFNDHSRDEATELVRAFATSTTRLPTTPPKTGEL